eukprot:TRINITY_DN32720_c0_g1_i1.p1 TRINITY_DN32720_c0_g1~~TRINITY_DN32720_c0_g1_i1.p1  ORF type:complete len:208 (+),score=59.61 TRINITY_DN32720_c0_g1_i1:38-661(+)
MLRQGWRAVPLRPVRQYHHQASPVPVPVAPINIQHIRMTVITPEQSDAMQALPAVRRSVVAQALDGDVLPLLRSVREDWARWAVAGAAVLLTWVWQSAALHRCDAMVTRHVETSLSHIQDTETYVRKTARSWAKRSGTLDSRITELENERFSQTKKLTVLTAALRESLIATTQWRYPRTQQGTASLRNDTSPTVPSVSPTETPSPGV